MIEPVEGAETQTAPADGRPYRYWEVKTARERYTVGFAVPVDGDAPSLVSYLKRHRAEARQRLISFVLSREPELSGST